MKKTIALILRTVLIVTSEILCCYPSTKSSGSACNKLQRNLVRRDQWRAQEPSGPVDCMWGPVRYVILHHTVSGACDTGDACAEQMRKLQKDHVAEKKWPDVGYHYVIGGDGKAYVGRSCGQMGGHTKNHNRKSIGVAFFGDFQKDAPPTDMLDLLPKIAYCAVEQGYLHPNFVVIGHRDAFCSTCPGDALYDVIRKWPRYPEKVPLHTYTCDATTTTVVPTTTTTPATTTVATTTEAATTTTTEAAPTTTATTTTEGPSPKVVALPVYVYFLLAKKPPPCCRDWTP